MKFSNCGRYLASGGHDSSVYLWDVATPAIISQFNAGDSVFSIDFSRDNTVLVAGTLGNQIKIWYIAKLAKDIEQSDDPSTFLTKSDAQSYEIGSFKTKLTPVIHLHFTRRNLLVGVGPFTTDQEL
jgi:transcription initiation factor TFIID subunit 5